MDLAYLEDRGLVGIELLALVYIFYGFYIVTDYHFVPAVTKLCNKWHIPDDVAGATILGAALNSPEIFSNLVGLYILDSPVGVGLIMGSFNFNILIIIGLTALSGRQTLRARQLKIEWRYLQRDALAYGISLGLLVWSTEDGELTSKECGVLLAAYALYVILCAATGRLAHLFCTQDRKPRRQLLLKNLLAEQLGGPKLLEQLVEAHRMISDCNQFEPNKSGGACSICQELLSKQQAQTAVRSLNSLLDGGWSGLRQARQSSLDLASQHDCCSKVTEFAERESSTIDEGSRTENQTSRFRFSEMVDSLHAHHSGVSTSVPRPSSFFSARSSMESAGTPLRQSAMSESIYFDPEMQILDEAILCRLVSPELSHLLDIDCRLIAVAVDLDASEPFASDILELAEATLSETMCAPGKNETRGSDVKEGELKTRNSSSGSDLDPALTLDSSEKDGKSWFHHALHRPVCGLINLTVPTESWLIVKCLSCMLWLALLAYSLDLVTGRVGRIFSLDDQLLGQTVVAAATSAPNVFAAIGAGKKGQVDAASSQAFGSNVFDILIAFNLPYAFKVWITGKSVSVNAEGVTRDSCIDLVVLVAFLIVLIFSRFRLTRGVGIVFVLAYGCLLVYTIIAFYVI